MKLTTMMLRFLVVACGKPLDDVSDEFDAIAINLSLDRAFCPFSTKAGRA
jgi:hypothetical protein